MTDDDRPERASSFYWHGRFDGLVTGGFWGFVAGMIAGFLATLLFVCRG